MVKKKHLFLGLLVLLLASLAFFIKDNNNTAYVASEKADKVVKTAKSKLGKKYVWGAEGPNTFDCSGLVYWAFQNQNNIKLASGRVTANSYYKSGKSVKWGSLKKGDLVFFDQNRKDSKIGHIGIYAGDSKFVHASLSYGKVVLSDIDDHLANPETGIEDKTEKTYRQIFVGARRVIGVNKETREETLKKGSKGNEVKTLQKDLKILGYDPGKIDGNFAGKTQSAVVNFQKKHGLSPDGIVGPKTREAIRAAKEKQEWKADPKNESLA